MNYEYKPYNINLLTEESVREKNCLYNDCIKLGVLLILYNVLNNVFAYLFYYISYFVLANDFTLSYDKVIDYLVDEKYELVTSTAYRMSANISITFFSLLIIALVGKFLMRIKLDGFLKPTGKGIKTAFVWLPGCFVINMIFSLLVAYLTSYLNTQGITVPTSDFSLSSASAASIIMQFSYVIVIAPIFEELIYRGLILGVLSKYGNSAAILFSALAFGLMHGNIPQAASAFGTGIVYAVIAVNCGSVVPTIIIHSMNNFIANLPDIASAVGIPQFDLMFSILEITIALAGFYVLFTRYNFLKYREHNKNLDKKIVSKTVFTNPVVIIYFVLMVIDMAKDIISAN